MGNFSRDNRQGRSRFGGSRSFGGNRGGFGGGRDRGFGDRGGFGGRRERRFTETEVVCAKCGKQTTVPFKPTGDKPVLCKECFSNKGSSAGNFESRERGSSAAPQGISQDQFKQLNSKLDRILKILEQVEFEDIEDEDSEGEEDIEEEEE